MTLIEANACGTPCIGSRVGGIVDVIEDGKNGFLVEEKNPQEIAGKVKFLIDNPQKRQEMAGAGQRIAKERFYNVVLANRLIRLYREILEK